ncbi:MAG: hypothetical protein SF028_15505 [Candidatus Sumerlaeia bacterium]|nr:hypothetical protein [Candidatus Sumerlaeia bacterium]
MDSVKIGLLLGDELDWPSTYESLLRRLDLRVKHRGRETRVECERVRIHPFALNAPTSYRLVIDRLAYWYLHPREWLKKAALLNDVYMINNPFTFQSMEKHAAYCAMMRCGIKIPETWLIPTKNPPADPTFARKYERTAAKYNDLFDLGGLGGHIGYPMYMKPFDGGGWRGVSRIADQEALYSQYDSSGQSLMHLQRAVEPYDVFVRSLAIGPQVISLRYDPTQPSHGRYQVDHAFLSERQGREARQLVKLINSFFRWEFNSCECMLQGDDVWAIDFANACPDIAINSLHYYYPWALMALVRWSVFCATTGRRSRINMEPYQYFEIGDSDRSYEEKLAAYEAIADNYFQRDEFEEFCEVNFPHLEEVAIEYFRSQEFLDMTSETIRDIFPPHEQEKYTGHFAGLARFWAQSRAEQLAAAKGK